MQLVVTEKPSVAQAISHVIGAKERKDGYMEGNGFLVSWCVGHLVELAQPEMYSEAWKKWSYESLPMIPEQWQHEVKKETATQYKILKNLKGGKITETTKTEMTGNEKAKLLPTDTGIVVNDFLMEYFPEIMDFNFTANVEKEFDEVAEGEKEWTGMMDSFYKGFHPLVDKTIHSKTEHKVGERVLGTDPVSGKPVSVKIGRFGPVIQIGTADDEEKPRFAQLTKGLSMETITLEEALDAFKLPRTLGDYDGHTVTVGVGRFGPYVRYDKLFVSIPKGTDPMEISLDEAVELIKNKIEAQEKKFIKVFDADPDMQVLNGRYGPYISYQKKNYKIPENVEPADLSLEACFKVIELQKSKAETRKTKAASRNRGTVNMEEESEKPEESAKSKAASKVKGTAKAKK